MHQHLIYRLAVQPRGKCRVPTKRRNFTMELEEGFLSEILGVGDVIHNAVDQHKNPPHVLGDKTALLFLRGYGFASDVGWNAALTHECLKGPCRRCHKTTTA